MSVKRKGKIDELTRWCQNDGSAEVGCGGGGAHDGGNGVVGGTTLSCLLGHIGTLAWGSIVGCPQTWSGLKGWCMVVIGGKPIVGGYHGLTLPPPFPPPIATP